MADTNEYAPTFAVVDADGDGQITAQEFQQLMQALGEELSDEGAAMAIQKMDSDGDGRISLEEFAEYMTANNA